MVKHRVLPILEKQKILYGKLPQAELEAWGDFYLEQGRIYDALDFYEKAQASARIRALRERAVKDGNQFLFQRTLVLLADEATASEVDLLTSRASTSGRETYARRARGEPPIPPPPEPDPPTPPSKA